MEWFSNLDPRIIWLVLSGIFFTGEMLTGTGWLLGVTLSALATAGLSHLFSATSSWQWVFFAVTTVLIGSFQGIKKIVYRAPAISVTLNDRASLMKGIILTLDRDLKYGSGQVNLSDSAWMVKADHDYPAGTKVRVTGMEGVFLLITAVDTDDTL